MAIREIFVTHKLEHIWYSGEIFYVHFLYMRLTNAVSFTDFYTAFASIKVHKVYAIPTSPLVFIRKHFKTANIYNGTLALCNFTACGCAITIP